MDVRFGRWWRRRPVAAQDAGSAPEPAAAELSLIPPDPVGAYSTLTDAPAAGAAPSAPEQPILLPATSSRLPSRVGVLVPATRSGSLLRRLPIPRVPKRTVLALGVCAGLAAPVVGRQLATQALLALLGQGRAARPLEGATVEIIRVHYAGSAAGHAASAVTKILEQVRR